MSPEVNLAVASDDLWGKSMKRDRRQVLTEYLVLSAQGGEAGAFQQLYALWADDLRRLALVRIQRVDEVDVVTQEAWLAIAQGLKRIDDPACFPRWAFQIVNRRAADWIRRQQSDRRRIESIRDAQITDSAINHGEQPSDDAQLLKRIIAELSADARELVYLYYDADRTVVEISTVLGVPIGTVKSRLFKVREIIKQQIERMTNEGPR
jgi:RNA polymerase sigma-70 factor (ECF subfamily)